MLKFISGVAPKGRYVSGKSTSGAGLTASVIKDEFIKGWALEAGAMVLSNKGVLCIDELEKMDENDRSTMHEAMEQQSVTISKANIQASLRSETAVLAAANPKFGRFDPTQMIAKQVDLAPSLLNRFDVIFILKDMPNRERDESIANHVLKEHRDEMKHDIIDKDLLRKYISYARKRVNPELSDEAVSEIKTFYVELRNRPSFSDSPIKPIPISARQLEALVRLSEAIARAKLSKKVTKEDAKEAIELVKFYMMQVGYDEETKTFDIDKISGNPASARSKIRLVLEAIERLENKLGKLIPVEELQKELGETMSELELEESTDKLVRSGDLFRPRKGFIQRM
jgi:replicative DNA helicase Mcm